jgi:hypothetical protein
MGSAKLWSMLSGFESLPPSQSANSFSTQLFVAFLKLKSSRQKMPSTPSMG